MTSTSPSKKLCRGLIRSESTLDISKGRLPIIDEKLPENPIAFVPYSTGFFSKLKRAFNSADTSNLPKYPIGGAFFKYVNSGSPLVCTQEQNLHQVYRFNNKAICHTYAGKESSFIYLNSFVGLSAKEHAFVAVEHLMLFEIEYLAISVYSQRTASTKVILCEVRSKRYTIFPFSQAGYVTKMSFSLLSDSSTESTSMEAETCTVKFLLTFCLHESKISGRVVTAEFSQAKGFFYKSDMIFEYNLSPCIKLSSFKTWVMSGSKVVIIGFGTTGGSFQLLKYLIPSTNDPPILINTFSAPISGFFNTRRSISTAPITWLDLKLLEKEDFLLMLGQGSAIYNGTTNPCKPSFLLVQLKQEFSAPSLLYSFQAGGNEEGAFTAASLINQGSRCRLAFAYWQGATAPLVKTHHFNIDMSSRAITEWHTDALPPLEGDIPLDFHSSELGCRLLTFNDLKEFPLPQPQTNLSHNSCIASDFFIEQCAMNTTAGCKDLILADMPLLNQFLTARPERELVLPPKDHGAAQSILQFVNSHAASPEYRNIIFCYCLSYLNMESARAFTVRFANTKELELASGYLLIDRGLIEQGVSCIIQADAAIHFPCKLIDRLLQSDHPNQGLRLFFHLRPAYPVSMPIHPRGPIKHLALFGIHEVHRILKAYFDGPISREEAHGAFFSKALADEFKSFCNLFSAFALTPEEEAYLRAFLKSDGAPKAALGNGLVFLVNYLMESRRYDEGFAFFFEVQDTIQALCSSSQWCDLYETVSSLADKLVIRDAERHFENALLEKKAQLHADNLILASDISEPLSPNCASSENLTAQEGVSPESNMSISAPRQESNVAFQGAKASTLHLPVQPQRALEDLQPLSQIWPPLGEAFPAPEPSSPVRFPEFVSVENNGVLGSKPRQAGSSSNTDTDDFNGYNTRSRAKKQKEY